MSSSQYVQQRVSMTRLSDEFSRRSSRGGTIDKLPVKATNTNGEKGENNAEQALNNSTE